MRVCQEVHCPLCRRVLLLVVYHLVPNYPCWFEVYGLELGKHVVVVDVVGAFEPLLNSWVVQWRLFVYGLLVFELLAVVQRRGVRHIVNVVV